VSKFLVPVSVLFLIFAPAFYFSRFSLPDSHIVRCAWKSGGQPAIGDVLTFKDSSIKINSGYIYKNDVVFAEITQREFRIFAGDKITIKNIKTDISGVYHEKGCK
jgi:hypothetical protein